MAPPTSMRSVTAIEPSTLRASSSPSCVAGGSGLCDSTRFPRLRGLQVSRHNGCKPSQTALINPVDAGLVISRRRPSRSMDVSAPHGLSNAGLPLHIRVEAALLMVVFAAQRELAPVGSARQQAQPRIEAVRRLPRATPPQYQPNGRRKSAEDRSSAL